MCFGWYTLIFFSFFFFFFLLQHQLTVFSSFHSTTFGSSNRQRKVCLYCKKKKKKKITWSTLAYFHTFLSEVWWMNAPRVTSSWGVSSGATFIQDQTFSPQQKNLKDVSEMQLLSDISFLLTKKKKALRKVQTQAGTDDRAALERVFGRFSEYSINSVFCPLVVTLTQCENGGWKWSLIVVVRALARKIHTRE